MTARRIVGVRVRRALVRICCTYICQARDPSGEFPCHFLELEGDLPNKILEYAADVRIFVAAAQRGGITGGILNVPLSLTST
jgi:hypothetical protein